MALGWTTIQSLIDRYLIKPILIALANKLYAWAGHASPTEGPAWKQNALNDFADWLQDLPESPDSAAVTADQCDLFTLLSEFSTLRQEIKFQNREQHAALKSLGSLQTDYERALQAFTTATQSIDTVKATIYDHAELKIAMPFLDIRDVLVRGLATAHFANQMPVYDTHRGIDGIVQGYEMALRRFDRALNQIDVQPITAVGQPFNANEMKAVGTACHHDKPAGEVLEEHLSGFKRNGRVIRTAEVVVNRHELRPELHNDYSTQHDQRSSFMTLN